MNKMEETDMKETESTNKTVFSLMPSYYQPMRMTLFIVLCLCMIVGNSLTIAAILRSKKLKKVPTNTFIINLAVADGLVGVLLIMNFFAILIAGRERLGRTIIYFGTMPSFTTAAASLFTLLVIAVDRFLAVAKPLYYKTRVSMTMTRVVCVLVWMTSLMVVGIPTCYYGYTQPLQKLFSGAAHDMFPKIVLYVIILPCILIPVLGNLVIYGYIIIKLRQRRNIGVTVSTPSRPSENHGPSGSTVNSKASNQDARMTAHITKMMVAIVTYLIISWSPYVILINLYNLNHPDTPVWFVYTFDLFAASLLYSNSAVNPIFYSWFSRDFRAAYASLLPCKRNRVSNFEEQGTTVTENPTAFPK